MRFTAGFCYFPWRFVLLSVFTQNKQAMDIRENWIVKIHNNLRTGKEKIHPKDYTFFNVEHIKNAASHTVKYINRCEQCKANKDELVALSEQFPEMLQTIGGRRQFNRRLDKVLTHLRKAHGVYPRGYFTGIFTVIGVVAGGIAGWLAAKAGLLSLYASMPVFLGLGLTAGWIYGQIRDKEVATQGKRL